MAVTHAGPWRKLYWDDPEVVSGVAGGLAGAITATFVCPLDVLKTRLQVQRRIPGVKYPGLGGSLTRIVAGEGVKGLYRGLTPTLLALFPNWAVYFSVYDRLKEDLSERATRGNWHVASPAIHMAAASGAGVATMLFTNPLWVIKTRLQTQNLGIKMGGSKNTELYRGTWDAFSRIYREEGIRGLYSGLLPSIMGVMHVMIQFPLYEATKEFFAEKSHCDVDDLRPLQLVTASALSKMVASTATYPHEVIRSHMHIEGVGSFQAFVRTCGQIYEHEGVKGFYRGCMTNLLRTTPAAALTFTSFELIARKLKEMGSKQRERERLEEKQVVVDHK